MSQDIIGKTLSLITKADVRYQGKLVEVDTVKKNITLKNVQDYGTEGRRNGENEVPKRENLLG